MSTPDTADALDAIERVLAEGGDADDALRRVVATLRERTSYAWAGILFVEAGGLQVRTVSAENVATQIVDSQARLRNLRSTESDLLRIMSRSGKIEDVLAVENQVSATREQIEQLDGEVQALKHRVAMSTVTVELQDSVATASVDVGIGTQLRDSWNAALHAMKGFTIVLVGALLWLVAFGPYIVGVALVGGLMALRWRRA